MIFIYKHRHGIPGSARVSRAGDGVPPSRTSDVEAQSGVALEPSGRMPDGAGWKPALPVHSTLPVQDTAAFLSCQHDPEPTPEPTPEPVPKFTPSLAAKPVAPLPLITLARSRPAASDAGSAAKEDNTPAPPPPPPADPPQKVETPPAENTRSDSVKEFYRRFL